MHVARRGVGSEEGECNGGRVAMRRGVCEERGRGSGGKRKAMGSGTHNWSPGILEGKGKVR